MKTPYNDAFIPPAPFLSVQASDLDDAVHSPQIPALIDTGSDMTLIPDSLPGQLQLAIAGRMSVQAYKGQPETTFYYDVILRVAQFRLVGLPVATFQADYVLLGRDVVNYIRLLLDGPALTLEVLAPAEP